MVATSHPQKHTRSSTVTERRTKIFKAAFTSAFFAMLHALQ